jgi:hypothetical protein
MLTAFFPMYRDNPLRVEWDHEVSDRELSFPAAPAEK